MGSMRSTPVERRKEIVGIQPFIPLGYGGSFVCAHSCVHHPMRPFLQHYNYILPRDLGMLQHIPGFAEAQSLMLLFSHSTISLRKFCPLLLLW